MGEAQVEKTTVAFKANLSSEMGVLYKDDDRMVIWGPASVEMVDKENDRILSDALKDALPQLLRRSRLSLEHSDQLVGDILEGFETDEAKSVEINGETYERSSYPTKVLDPEEDDVPEKGLYVAGEVWNDTQQARDTQEKIQEGVIDSYSISGEAIQSSTRVKDGELVDDIKEIDLSAVTLCEEGMNQRAKFAVISKSAENGISPGELSEIARSTLSKTMGDNEEEEGEDPPDNASEAAVDKQELREEFKAAAEEVLSQRDFATKDDVQSTVESMLDEKEDDPDGSEMPVDPEDDEDTSEEEEEEKSGDLEQKVDRVLELLDEEEMPEEEEEPVDPDEIEDPDDDGEEEVDLDPEEDEDMPPEDGKGDTVPLEQLKSELPEDLYRAVTDHMTDPGDGEVEASESAKEDEEEDEEVEDEGDMEQTEKSATESYLEGVGPVAPAAAEELEKSHEQGDPTDPAGEGGDEPGTEPGTLDELYKSMGEEV